MATVTRKTHYIIQFPDKVQIQNVLFIFDSFVYALATSSTFTQIEEAPVKKWLVMSVLVLVASVLCMTACSKKDESAPKEIKIGFNIPLT